MSEQSSTPLKYLGGYFIHGVPARDLTAHEAQQHAAVIEEQEKLTGIKLYEPVKTTAKAVKQQE